jgi:DNA-directed RNA polymerase subunit M/transcription elongation factor TFIIS
MSRKYESKLEQIYNNAKCSRCGKNINSATTVYVDKDDEDIVLACSHCAYAMEPNEYAIDRTYAYFDNEEGAKQEPDEEMP